MIPLFTDQNLQTELRSPGGLPTLDGTFSSPYRLDVTTVDYELARKLYYNRDERYKLGAGFARPSIDVPVGFMGVPMLKAVDDDEAGKAQEWLDRHVDAWSGQIMKAHKMALRDGEVLVRLIPKNRSAAYARLFGEDDKDLDLVLIPTEAYEVITADEDIDSIEAIKIKHVFMRADPGSNNMREVVLFETIVNSSQEYHGSVHSTRPVALNSYLPCANASTTAGSNRCSTARTRVASASASSPARTGTGHWAMMAPWS